MRDLVLTALTPFLGSPLIATVVNITTNFEITLSGSFVFGGFLTIVGLLVRQELRTLKLEGGQEVLHEAVTGIVDVLRRMNVTDRPGS